MLATHAMAVNDLTGERIAVIVQLVSAFASGVCVAVAVDAWLSVAIYVTVPLALAAGALSLKSMQGFTKVVRAADAAPAVRLREGATHPPTQSQAQLEQSSNTLSEAIAGIEVIKSFGLEGHVLEQYKSQLDSSWCAVLRLASP